MGVKLHRDCPCSQLVEGFHFGGLRILFLLFADIVVLLVSSGSGLVRTGVFHSCVMRWELESASPKSEAMVVSEKRVNLSLTLCG